MDTINEKVGAWLLEGHTRAELAARIGISRQTLDTRLTGASRWLWREVIELAQVLGVTLNALAGIE